MPEWMNIPALPDEQPERRIHIERYEYAAKVLAGKRVLDCACGMGYGTESLSRTCTVTGVDIDPEAVSLARQQYPQLAFSVGDIHSVSFEGYDALVSFETLEHLQDPHGIFARLQDDSCAINEVVVSAPIRPTVGWNPWHKSDFTHGSFCQMIEQVFRIVHVVGQPWVDDKGDLYLMVHGRRGAWTL
jgi:SAM-dependent methyltransferase